MGSVPGASEKYFSVQLKKTKTNKQSNKQTDKSRLLKLNARSYLLARSLAKVTVLYS